MDEVHVLVHADEVEDGGGIGVATFLVADVANHFEESDAVLGGTLDQSIRSSFIFISSVVCCITML